MLSEGLELKLIHQIWQGAFELLQKYWNYTPGFSLSTGFQPLNNSLYFSAGSGLEKNIATELNECWGMDFVSDQLYNSKHVRVLILIDTYSRECLSIYTDKAIKGETVANVVSGGTITVVDILLLFDMLMSMKSYGRF